MYLSIFKLGVRSRQISKRTNRPTDKQAKHMMRPKSGWPCNKLSRLGFPATWAATNWLCCAINQTEQRCAEFLYSLSSGGHSRDTSDSWSSYMKPVKIIVGCLKQHLTNGY